MKKIILMSLLVFLSAAVHAETIQPANVAAVTAESTAPTGTAAVTTPTKKMTLKQRIQMYWNKIANFDYQSLNIVGKTEKFVAGKKKQNLESFEGVETGIWKHTKRAPTSGQAKEIADKLDKTSQEKIKKYDSINTY